MRRWIIWSVLGLLVSVTLSGCASLGYYAQSIGGQWELWHKRRPISTMLTAPDTPLALRDKLQAVLQMRDFASRELALPDNDSYRSYADLQRPFVVWNVFAAKPYDTSLQQWCFPFAGCVGYRGYFSAKAAQAYAEELNQQGLEAYVGGVAAYSTLGWFDDPMLNTVINRSPARIAGLIFHELAHQQMYVKGDTTFNEGFATTVELEGVRRWLAAYGNEAQRQAYAQFRQRQDAFVDLVVETRDQLQTLYDKNLSKAEKQAGKTAIKIQLRQRYQQLKQQWGGYSGYDAWFAQDLNNAQLAAVTTYRDRVPAFQRLLARVGGDMAAFYRACAEVGAMPKGDRAVALARVDINS